MRPMITIAVAGQKGGISKTTSSVSISAALVREGFRVLLVDMDAQASSTQWLTDYYGERGRDVEAILKRTALAADCILHTAPGIDVIPSTLWFSSIDLEMAAILGRERRLAAALEPVGDRYDFCVIDCPPSLGLATANALMASQVAIVPIDCRLQALLAVPQILSMLAEVSEERRETVGVYALPTFFERTNLARDILAQIEQRFEAATLPAIHKNTRLAEAFVAKKTIFQFDPTALGAVDYTRVAKELADDLAPRPRAKGSSREATRK